MSFNRNNLQKIFAIPVITLFDLFSEKLDFTYELDIQDDEVIFNGIYNK